MRFAVSFLLAVSVFAASPSQLASSVPIRFEPNRGQIRTTSKDPVQWLARGLDYAFLFNSQSSILNVGGHTIGMQLEGAKAAVYQPASQTTGNTGYLTADLQESVPTYSRLRRADAYPGIDVLYYGNGEHLEYDFEVAPGADPSRIRILFEGAEHVRLSPAGDLLISMGAQTLTQRAPVAYQVTPSGNRTPVKAAYQMNQGGFVSIALGTYDHSARLVIDPELVMTRFFFGTRTDTAISVGHDNHGFVYIAGNTQSTDFYLLGETYFNTNSGRQDIWVMKLDPRSADESTRVPYSTYVGGLGIETVRAMAVDPVTGLVYLTGSTTTATQFPEVTSFQRTNQGGTDAFLAVLDPTKTLFASVVHLAFVGGTGTDEGRGIAVFNGKAYITGQTASSNFPVKNAIQGTLVAGAEIFVSEFDPTKTGDDALISSTFITGGANDYARSIAVDAQGKVYIAGITYSPGLPTTANAFQGDYLDGGEGFLLKLDLEAQTVLYGTYLRGSGYDEIKKVIVEPSGRVALTGYTMSADFPVTQDAYQPQLNGIANAFLTIVDPSKSGLDALAYSTYFGGSNAEVAYDMARDISGKYYIVGYTLSENLATTIDAMNQVSALGSTDGFFTVLDPAAGAFASLVYSTYITSPGSQIAYGVDVDLTNMAFIVGSASNNIFPAGQATRELQVGNTDGFFAAFQFPPPPESVLEAFKNQQWEPSSPDSQAVYPVVRSPSADSMSSESDVLSLKTSGGENLPAAEKSRTTRAIPGSNTN